MQIRAEPRKSALPICNYSQILYQFLTFTQNLKRSRPVQPLLDSHAFRSLQALIDDVFPALFANLMCTLVHKI